MVSPELKVKRSDGVDGKSTTKADGKLDGKAHNKHRRINGGRPFWGDFEKITAKLAEPEQPSGPWPSWTVKNVPMEEREFIATAARKAGTTIGPWLIETAHQRVRMEELTEMKMGATLLPNGVTVSQHVAPAILQDGTLDQLLTPESLALREALALSAEARALAMTKGCGKLGAKMRRVAEAHLARSMPPLEPPAKEKVSRLPGKPKEES